MRSMAGSRTRASEAALDLGAVELRDRLAAGALKVADLAEAAIARIEATEPELRAWAWFEPEFVRAQARALDAHRATGRPIAGSILGANFRTGLQICRCPTGSWRARSM